MSSADVDGCVECATPRARARRFCGMCGRPVARTCPRCGFDNELADRYCGGCGGRFAVKPRVRVAGPGAPAPAASAPASPKWLGHLSAVNRRLRERVESARNGTAAEPNELGQAQIDALFQPNSDR